VGLRGSAPELSATETVMTERLAPMIDIAASLDVLGEQYRPDMIKLESDLDRYRHVIRTDRPDVIIECGTWHGGSARWFAETGADVITIDTVRHQDAHRGSRITWITGNSADPELAMRVADMVVGRRTMVILDSDHSADHVAAEIRLYAPLVSPGCHLVIEDGIVRWMPRSKFQGSPLDAIEQFMPADPTFERDGITEAMYPTSMYPCGWWIKRGMPCS